MLPLAARVQKWIWVLVYAGIVLLGLGLMVRRDDAATFLGQVARKLRRIQPHPHGIAPFAIHRYIGHAIKVLEAVRHEAVDIVRKFKGRH